jgi:hypothetical protein
MSDWLRQDRRRAWLAPRSWWRDLERDADEERRLYLIARARAARELHKAAQRAPWWRRFIWRPK